MWILRYPSLLDRLRAACQIVVLGTLNLAIFGSTLRITMTIHLFQFRFGAPRLFNLCPLTYLVNIGDILGFWLNLLWVDRPGWATAGWMSSSHGSGGESASSP